MKKRYSFWTAFTSLKDELRLFLRENHIFYELSGTLADYYFSITATPEEARLINNWLDSHTITEEG